MRMWDSVKAAAAGVEDDGSYDSPDGPEDCAARRAAALATTPAGLGLPDDPGGSPFGVVAEVGGTNGVTTLIAFATGEASLLTPSGDGIIGRPAHVHVVVQAQRLVEQAGHHLAQLEPAAGAPPPAPGAMRFFVLTGGGILTAEAPLAVLRAGGHALSPLLDVADDLMSEFHQYALLDAEPLEPSTPGEILKAFALAAIIAGLTCAAWLIPTPWLRWPAVAIGAFFTIAALIVPWAMLTESPPAADPPEGAA